MAKSPAEKLEELRDQKVTLQRDVEKTDAMIKRLHARIEERDLEITGSLS